MTAVGPLPGNRSSSRLLPPVTWPADVTKSSRSTKARLLWRRMMKISLAEIAISGAPPGPGGRVSVVVTDLGLLEPRGEDRELVLTHVHPGIDAERAVEATGWPLHVADDLRETRAPTDEELAALRGLATKGAR